MAGARPLALSARASSSRRASPLADLRAEVEAMARGGARGRRPDRHRRHQGGRARQRRRHVRLHDRRRGARPARRPRPRATLAAGRPDHRCPGRSASTASAIMLARDEFELEADDRVRHRARSGRRWTRCWTTSGPGAALPARRHARRRGLRAQRARARVGRGDARERGAPCRSSRRSRARPSSSGSTRCTWPTRASSWPSWRPEGADAALAALRVGAGLRGGGGDRRGEDRAARDGAGGHRLRRQAGDGSARGRSAAANLLTRGG